MYIGLGVVLVVIGAVLSFVLDVDAPWISGTLLGWILMVAGVLAILFSITMRARSGYSDSAPGGDHTDTACVQGAMMSGQRAAEGWLQRIGKTGS